MWRSAFYGLALSSVWLFGCDRAIEPYVPGEQPEKPDLARIFPEANRSDPTPAPSPGGDAAPAPAPGTDALTIHGIVRVSDELSSAIPSGAVLFVIARTEGGGPPLAVKRIQGARFPAKFSLGPDDRMIAARPFSGPLELSAWIDQDGNVTSRVSGDLQGTAPGRYEPGAAGIEIEVDQRL